MDWNRIEGNWKQLAGKVQERYGIALDNAEREVADWERRAGPRFFD